MFNVEEGLLSRWTDVFGHLTFVARNRLKSRSKSLILRCIRLSLPRNQLILINIVDF